jgi:hypothetical protein
MNASTLDIAQLARNNIYPLRHSAGEGRKRHPPRHGADGRKALRMRRRSHPHISVGRPSTALRYAARADRTDAIKVVVTNRQAATVASAAE